MRDILLVSGVIACSIAALRRPLIGLLTFIALGFLNPHSLAWGSARTLPLSQFVAIGTIVGYLFSGEAKRFPKQREAALLLAFWGVTGLSTAFAIYPETARDQFLLFSKVLLMTFLSTCLVNTQRRLYWFINVIALSIAFLGIKGGIFVLLTGGQYTVWGPENSFLAANNAIGLALAMNVPLLLYLSKMATHPWHRWTLRLGFLLSYPAAVATYSRGAWLGLAVVTAFLILRSRRRVPLLAATCALVLLAGPLVFVFLPERVADRYEDLVNYDEEASAQSRLYSWEFCKRVGLAHPILGAGFDFYSPETYATYFPGSTEYWSTRLGRTLAWSCHSIWFTILGEHGFTGLLLWFGLLMSCFLSLRQIRLHGRANANLSHLVEYAHMLQASLLAFVVVGTFLDAAYFDMLYYIVGAIVVLKEGIRETNVEASTADFLQTPGGPLPKIDSRMVS